MTIAKSRISLPLVLPAQRLLHLSRSYGLARTTYSMARKVFAWPGVRHGSRCFFADVMRMPLSAWDTARRIPSCFQVRRAHADDLPALNTYFGPGHDIDERWDRGDICVVTSTNGTIGAALWLLVGPGLYREDEKAFGCEFELPRRSVWAFDGKGTRLGAWGSLMAQLPRVLDDVEMDEVLTVIECNNWHSAESHKSFGFQSIGVVGCLWLGGTALSVYRPPGGRWRRTPGALGNVRLVQKEASARDA